MAYEARIELDSVTPYGGNRLTTMVVTYPKFVHSEFMTHRMFSRNAASSRAIPIEKLIERVESGPVIPVYWGKNQKGMVAETPMTDAEAHAAEVTWLSARTQAVAFASVLRQLGSHKQIVNRLLEPFSWITVIVTATDWGNFFELRCAANAQPEIRKIAEMMHVLYRNNVPTKRNMHCPFVSSEEGSALDSLERMRVSAARCARVSYLNHDKTLPNIENDLALADRLAKDGHWSPFEHAALSRDSGEYFANFRAWESCRRILGRAPTAPGM